MIYRIEFYSHEVEIESEDGVNVEKLAEAWLKEHLTDDRGKFVCGCVEKITIVEKREDIHYLNRAEIEGLPALRESTA